MSLVATLKKSPKPLLISLAIHVVIGLSIVLNLDTQEKVIKQTNANPIQARMVTNEELNQFKLREDEKKQKVLDEKKRLADIQKKKIKAEADKKKREKEKIIRQQKLAKEKQTLKKKNDQLKKDKARKEQKKIVATKAKAKAEKLKKAQEKQQLEEEKKLRQLAIEAENKLRQLAIEAENKRIKAETQQLAEIAKKQAIAKQLAKAQRLKKENEIRAAKRQRLLTQLNVQYISAIQQKIARNWRRPNNLPKDFSCELSVSQLTTGDVISVRLGRCKGDELFKRSVQDAAWRASPLPQPADPELYERNIEFTFKPE